MNTVVKLDQEESAIVTLCSIVQNVATNKDVDVDKMSALLDMQERILNRNAKQEFSSALANLQAELPEVEKLATGHNSKYAKFEHILAAIKPHLIKYGFAITHRCDNREGLITVTAVLSHKGGHSEETSVVLPADASGGKNAVQSIGSSMEYGRRYTMNALLGIATKDADVNGGNYQEPEGLAIALNSIKNAKSLAELQKHFGAAWKMFVDKQSRDTLNNAYLPRKQELSNG